jgi:hypothetical protein
VTTVSGETLHAISTQVGRARSVALTLVCAFASLLGFVLSFTCTTLE